MEILTQIWNWLSQNYQFTINIIIQIIIAYHVYFLSIRLSDKAKLKHKEEILNKCEPLFSRINKEEQAIKLHLVNTSRYYKDYPSNDLNIHGYSHIKAELKSARFDGLEFFCSSPEYIYKRKDGKLTTKKEGNKLYCKAFPVGLVPYDWIDHIDISGDEYGYVPQIFCSFKGSIYWKNSLFNKIFRGYPYSKIMYYIESDVFHSNNDPFIMKYMRIKEPILKT